MATWGNMICERIKDLMREKALSQKELCEQTNMIQSSVSAILNGKRSPMPIIDSVCEIFGVNKEWLLSGVGMKYKQSNDIANAILCDNSAISDKMAIIKEMNELYKKHQSLLQQAQEIMETIVDMNKKILLSDDYVM